VGKYRYHRTTRRVQPTQAGETLYRECRPLLAGLQEALAAARRTRARSEQVRKQAEALREIYEQLQAGGHSHTSPTRKAE
jgi:hypothetical protein